MNKEKEGFVAWVKDHKKELMIVGVSAAAIIMIIAGVKNKDALLKLWNTLRASVAKAPAPVSELRDITSATPSLSMLEIEKVPALTGAEINKPYPVNVSEHIRNLHPGWKASAEKIAEAKMMGIPLLPGQTIVDGYTKGGLAA